MNKEVYHEGWLIKSPPTKRIWRARWRRRWFTLKQGEIPGQFCLEYYTDRNCRKLKGIIDLDQCEQVDSGLRLEHRKQKFQNMFDVKTPRRIFYLAADSEEDMHDWVNCICQVCNLQDLSKQTLERQYYNIKKETSKLKSNETINNSQPINNMQQTIDTSSSSFLSNSLNNDELNVNKFEMLKTKNNSSINNASTETNYYNLTSTTDNESMKSITPSIYEQSSVNKSPASRLSVKGNETISMKITPTKQVSTGPYIPISECFSGSPNVEHHALTPLNSLDPKFYETPRGNLTFGLNLTNEQPYSPKRNNFSYLMESGSGRTSPTDSESVFTDDEEWTEPSKSELKDRNLRPSDSSNENDSIIVSYCQRFSKVTKSNAPPPQLDSSINSTKGGAGGSKNSKNDEEIINHTKKEIDSLHINNGTEERNQDVLSSDTENASPAIGPKNSNSFVEESYDIPRSHQMPYYNLSKPPKMHSGHGLSATSTPNLISTDSISKSTTSINNNNRSHFYSNAAPSNVDNIFRFDFQEKEPAPTVYRDLKPKINCDEKRIIVENKEIPSNGYEFLKSFSQTLNRNSFPTHNGVIQPPSIDRTRKPTLKLHMNEFYNDHSLDSMSKTLPRNYNNSSSSSAFASASGSVSASASASAATSTPLSCSTQSIKPIGYLEYIEMDPSALPLCELTLPLSSSISNNSKIGSTSMMMMMDRSTDQTNKSDSKIVYKSVDFIKTEAIKKTRQDRTHKHS